jgi:hypothetical protein
MASAERKAKNEAFFREINENIADLVEHSPTIRSSPVAFVCECAAPDCAQALEITLDTYQEIRSDPARFLVVPGHVAGDVERVVMEGGHYLVVEKIGVAEAIAEATDPNG